MNTSDSSFDASLLQNAATTGLPSSSTLESGDRLFGHTQSLSVAPSFVKGINFNGDAVTIDGHQWLSHQQAVNDGLVIGPADRYKTSFTPSPKADADTRDMLKTGLEANSKGGTKDLLIQQPLENGEYQVDLWVMSPTKRDRTFDVELEGVTLDRVTASGSKGKWKQYSYSTTVTDGQLDLVLEKGRKSPVISGIEFSSLLSPEGPVPPTSIPTDEGPTLPNPDGLVGGAEDSDDQPAKPDSGDNNGDTFDSPNTPVDVGTPPPPIDRPIAGPSPTGGKLIWQNNFSGNWEKNWPNFQNTTAPENRQVIRADGNDILRVNFDKGGVGPSAGTQFKSTFTPLKSATLQYDVRFKEGFDPVLGGKLPGFTGGLAGRKRENTGGNTPDGTDGWSVRLGFRPAKSNPDALALRTYSYLPPGQQNPKQNNEYVFDAWGNKTFWSGKGKWGLSNHFLNPDNPESGKDLEIQTGKWYTVSLQVNLNTPGKTDGSIRAFIKQPGRKTSQLAIDVPNLTFQNSGSNLPIDRVFFSTFFGGSSSAHKARREEHIDFDNFQVFKHS